MQLYSVRVDQRRRRAQQAKRSVARPVPKISSPPEEPLAPSAKRQQSHQWKEDEESTVQVGPQHCARNKQPKLPALPLPIRVKQPERDRDKQQRENMRTRMKV